jgi:transposase
MNALTIGLKNENGKSRTFEENKLLIYAIQAALNRRIEALQNKTLCPTEASWRHIEEEVARDFRVRRENITDLRKEYFRNGEVLMCGEYAGDDDDVANMQRGAANPKYHQRQQKLFGPHYLAITKFVDDKHSKGQGVTNRKVRNHLRKEFGVKVDKRSIRRIFRKLGLTWMKVRPKRRTLNAFRRTSIRDFLIKFDEYYRHIRDDNPKGYVFVYLDESYVHQTHAGSYSYCTADDNHVNRSAGKGRRLIILHAITENGPLCELDDNGRPVDILEWNGDTPHPPKDLVDGSLTCETLWLATSKSGDYHDNMNSEMFMMWVQHSLVPTFEKLNPGKIMILVANNAAYHHKREIGSLQSTTKKKLLDMMVKYEVDTVDLPATDSQFELSKDSDESGVEDQGEIIRIYFEREEQEQRAGANKTRVGTLEEVKISFITWLQENNPKILGCQLERYLADRHHKVLWTPPNHIANHFIDGIKMKQTVSQLRDGGYGNSDRFEEGDD